MPVKWKHGDEYCFYFCTFTCYKDNQHVIGYVIMPNHLHVIIYFPKPGIA